MPMQSRPWRLEVFRAGKLQRASISENLTATSIDEAPLQTNFPFDVISAISDESLRLVEPCKDPDDGALEFSGKLLLDQSRFLLPKSDSSSNRWSHLRPRDANRRQKRSEKRKQRADPIKSVTNRRCKTAKILPSRIDSGATPVTSSGWMGRRRVMPRGGLSLTELVDRGLKLVEWDGHTSHRLVDSAGRQIGLLVGRPRGDSWDAVIKAAESNMREAQKELSQECHARGNFASSNVGISYGGGEKKPGNFRLRVPAFGYLLKEEAFQRIAGFGSSALQCYAPALYAYYKETLEALLEKDEFLRRNFSSSVFAACTFNVGPYTVTQPHIDAKNLAWGLCAITSLGNFNPDLGGHLVLWDLGLIIRFPPGSTIFIQSAVLTHSNVPIAKGEERFSFTQYSAAGLFRWVQNGFQSDKELLGLADDDEVTKFESAKKTRWAEGLAMLEAFDL